MTTPNIVPNLSDSPSLRGLSGAAKLKELVRLKKMQSAVITLEGGKSLDHLEQLGAVELNKATAAIRETQKEVILRRDDPFTEPEVSYNEAQLSFIEAVLEGKPVALSGPAGSGKTTVVKGAIRQLIQQDKVGVIKDDSHRWLHHGTPAIACVAFTNKAVENMKKVLPPELRGNCITIHKLLEYGPVFFEELNDQTGENKRTMAFVPKYDEVNPLLSDLEILIIDEASMVAVDLWNVLAAALHHRIQIILIGDIQQLPPVFGKSIFIHSMQANIKKVELTEVHRQALQSPIIALAHKILAGQQIHPPKLEELNYDGEHGKLTIKPWKKRLSDIGSLKQLSLFLPALMEAGQYDPMEDVILTPFNVNFGTQEMNKIIANHLITKIREVAPNSEEAKLYEIAAGIKKAYFRVGDKVLHNKTEHVITSIHRNTKYFGKLPQSASIFLDYNGYTKADMDFVLNEDAIGDVDAILDSMNLNEETKDRKRACSHIVTLYSSSLDEEVVLETGSEVASLEHAYAITVHKSQGSEYNRVLFITHHTQASMFYRELIYTAVTRAKKELLIICPPSLLVQGINTQKLPGKNLSCKIEAFERACALQKGAAEKPLKMEYFNSDWDGN